MRSCSITNKVQIVPGCLDDYKQLAHYHYRDNRLTAYAAVFALRLLSGILRIGDETIGVIVYSMPRAVMGLVNPFLERAGMKAFIAKMPARCVQLTEAFSMVGIEKEQLVDPKKIQRKLEQLQPSEAEFIEFQIQNFLQSYGKRRNMPPGAERTRYILSKLTFRPVYYIWFNPKIALRE